MKKINVHSVQRNYTITINENLDFLIKKYLKPSKKYFVVVDNKVNKKYTKLIKSISKESVIYPIEGGEEAKSIETYQDIIDALLKNNIAKSDELIAFGGGTIGDLVGYIAGTYKRGITYINIPTTTLSMIDSSIGGKTAINFNGIKNALGIINPARRVLIGLDVLSSLDERNYNNGLFEALKISLIANKRLFNILYFNNPKSSLIDIIYHSLKTKKKFVEKDEFDINVRRKLNFGHTIGHAIELNGDLLHGEAVANGMLCMSYNKPYYQDIKNILVRLKCPIKNRIRFNEIINIITNDKKVHDEKIDLIFVNKIGKAEIKTVDIKEMKGLVDHYVF